MYYLCCWTQPANSFYFSVNSEDVTFGRRVCTQRSSKLSVKYANPYQMNPSRWFLCGGPDDLPGIIAHQNFLPFLSLSLSLVSPISLPQSRHWGHREMWSCQERELRRTAKIRRLQWEQEPLSGLCKCAWVLCVCVLCVHLCSVELQARWACVEWVCVLSLCVPAHMCMSTVCDAWNITDVWGQLREGCWCVSLLGKRSITSVQSAFLLICSPFSCQQHVWRPQKP